MVCHNPSRLDDQMYYSCRGVFLVCHVDQVKGYKPLKVSHHPAKFDGH